MLGPKRAKTETDVTQPTDITMEESDGEKRQLSEISTKLSSILSVLNELTDLMRQSSIAGSGGCTNAGLTSEITKIMKAMEEKVMPRPDQMVINNPSTSTSQPTNILEAEAMKIKTSISQIWSKKLDARKDAYWAFVRNRGNLSFHEKWTSGEDSRQIIIPRKHQKFEIENEDINQKQLREKAVAQDFKMEMELERLQVESCMNTARQLDSEMHEIIKNRCNGRVAEICISYWVQDISRNEEISHKRWKHNERWLQKYEENFIKEYENKSPFFKPKSPQNSRKNVNNKHQGNKRNSRRGNQNFEQGYQVNNGQSYNRRGNGNQNHQTYAAAVQSTPANSVEGLLQQVLLKLNNPTPAGPPSPPAPRSGGYRGRGRGHGRGRGKGGYSQARRWGNRSNNSNNEFEHILEPADYFRQADHNWDSNYQ